MEDVGMLSWLDNRTANDSNNNGTLFQIAWAALHLGAAVQHARAFRKDGIHVSPLHGAAVIMHTLSFVYHARRIRSAKSEIPPTQRVPN